MRKNVVLFTAVLLAILFVGCRKDTAEYAEPANFYYVQQEISYNSSSGVICPEIIDVAEYCADLSQIFNAYLTGPISQDLDSPFPKGTNVHSCSILDQEAVLTLSKEFSALSGAKLATACSCMTLTVAELTGVEVVRFQIDGDLIDGKEQLTVVVSDIVLLDDTLRKG